jgi:hypothetical protein
MRAEVFAAALGRDLERRALLAVMARKLAARRAWADERPFANLGTI